MRVTACPPQGVTLDVTSTLVGADPAPWRRRTRYTVLARASANWEGRVTASFDLPAQNPWWLIPGLFYGENRPEGCDRLFPRYNPGPPDKSSLTSNAWSFRADRAATVAVFAWGDNSAAALATQATSPAGLNGLGFSWAANQATIHLSFPYAESPWTYFGDATPRPASGQTVKLAEGESLTVEFDLFELDTDRHAYGPVLAQLHQESIEHNPLRPWLDVASAANLTAFGLHQWHYRPDPPVLVETAAFDRAIDGDKLDRQAMHVAWVSGIPWAYALLRHARRTGNATLAEAGRAVTDFCCAELSPSGTFYGTWYREQGWKGSWTTLKNGLHARTLGEATLFLLRALAEETAAGLDHPTWHAAIVANLRHMLARQRPDGNLGAVHDLSTGEVLLWEGAAGLTWVAALVEAAELAETLSLDKAGLSVADLTAAATRAGQHYSCFVLNEFINGAPEDVDLAPTSEDGFAAVMAYTALARLTGHQRWLDLARRSAEWMLTFRYSYNVDFDPHTLLGKYEFATRGGDQASVSNQHLGSYGLVCAAEMAELAKLLGEAWPLERTKEASACFRQFIARQDGDFNAQKGMVTERYYQTDCFAPKGSILTLSHAWCLGVQLLAFEQELDGWSRLAKR